MNEPTTLKCMVCHGPVKISLTRKGNGLYLMCQKDGRHFRGFVMDKEYVLGVISRAEDLDS
ncbi:MAG: hypothetical protein IH899_08160 [Planctomycetes bacterium]|nr:hypothetical protein [Planctomycetota bacterium]